MTSETGSLPGTAGERHHFTKRVTLVCSVALLLAVGSLALRYLDRSQRRLSAAPAKVSEATVELRTLSMTVTSTGTLRLQTGSEVRVGAQISGIVSKLSVTVGSHVTKGEAIAEIDSRGLDARIQQARSQIGIDEATLEKTERDLARSRALSEAGLVARRETEDLEEDRKGAEAKLAKSRSDLAVVESDLPYLVIRAPIEGIVSAVTTQQGETVAASFSAPNFVTVIKDQALELVAMVDETDIGNVKASDPVVFTTETYPSRDFSGTVSRIAPKATIISGVVNYEVGIAIRDGLALLKPDMTANVTIQTVERQALMIPDKAVHKDGEKRYVYLRTSDQPEKREVILGQREGSLIEVKRGLKQNDRVLVGIVPGDTPKENA